MKEIMFDFTAMNENYLLPALAGLSLFFLALLAIVVIRMPARWGRFFHKYREEEREQENLRYNQFSRNILSQLSPLREEFSRQFMLAQKTGTDQAREDRKELREHLENLGVMQGNRLGEIREAMEKVLHGLSQGLERLRSENSAKLEEMRLTVDEKLAHTLEKRLGDSFMLVSRQLEQVYKSVGEMQNLAVGVGDLKKILTNVKSRGTWGEIQLGNLLENMFTPDQLLYNAEINPNSGQRVEFALRMPGREQEVLLPLDAKFPQEDYERLLQAGEEGNREAEEAALKALEQRVRLSAKEIKEKYICPPYSTEMAIMFLPTEGLYAEILRRPGLMDALQREYKVLAAGPSSLSALLTCLQMGFRTLAIEKKASDVWRILGTVKTEFARYGQVMDKLRKKLQEADRQLDQIATRHRAMDRTLREVEQVEGVKGNDSLILELMQNPGSDEGEAADRADTTEENR
jgi:DNA recombination protein RmuC